MNIGHHHQNMTTMISVDFLGYVSSFLFGSFSGPLADIYGRRMMAMVSNEKICNVSCIKILNGLILKSLYISKSKHIKQVFSLVLRNYVQSFTLLYKIYIRVEFVKTFRTIYTY